jgi:hypothetical protein
MPRTFKYVGCEIIYREACALAARCEHRVDIEHLRKGLHDLQTGQMRDHIQTTIDATDPQPGYEAILMGYARCNDGLVGVTARDVPLVIPRAHDCITFLFGSREAYKTYFDTHPGTYFESTGWSERNLSEDDYATPAYGKQGVMADMGLAQSREELIAQYGEDNADFIADLLGSWESNYSRCLYLTMGVCDETAIVDAARKQAEDKGWEFEVRDGSMKLLEKLFAGEWDDDFLIVQPGQRIVARNDASILAAE